MQHILSEEEYTELKAAAQRGDAIAARFEGCTPVGLSTKALQKLCTQIADTMPIKFWKNKEAKPWGCLITVEKEQVAAGSHPEWYCDECPAHKICPHPYKAHSQ